MILRICVCCGEPIAEGSNAVSRNPNVCAFCSSLADGEGGEAPTLPPSVLPASKPPKPQLTLEPDEKVVDWHA